MNRTVITILLMVGFSIWFIVTVPMYILLTVRNFENEHPEGLKRNIVEFLNDIVKKANRKAVFKVVRGSSLKGSIHDVVFGKQGRETEEEYKQLLLDMQPWFDDLASGAKSLADDHYINPDDMQKAVSAKYVFENHAITVRYCKGGYMHVDGDGRHRFLVAQKYDLTVLVKVQPPSSLKEKYYEICHKINYHGGKTVH